VNDAFEPDAVSSRVPMAQILGMTTRYQEQDHPRTFEQAWADPRNTRFELPPVDVNRVLSERYLWGASQPLTLTRAMIWDMEARKARHPERFIQYVLAEGSADVWDERPAPPGLEIFMRRSEQRLWREPEKYELILEQTHVDHAAQKVTFIGTAEYPDREGNILHAGKGQPIFHVVHGAAGAEHRPLNTWAIVFLTDAPDPSLLEPFARIARDPYLPGYLENYIREHLGVALTRT
jgi:hypothetical protein